VRMSSIGMIDTMLGLANDGLLLCTGDWTLVAIPNADGIICIAVGDGRWHSPDG
jgi:hypothetical protein